MSLPIQSALCLQMHGNCSTSQRLGNGGNSVEHDHKLIGTEGSIMSLLTKYELNLISSLSTNTQKLLNQSEARKQQNSIQCDHNLGLKNTKKLAHQL